MAVDNRFVLVGTVGVPASYGGFETLAENLVRYHADQGRPEAIAVYCEADAYPERPDRYLGAELRYVPLRANGVQSIVYDIWSLLDAAFRRTDAILVLGVSGAIALPIVRLISRARVVTNIDGIEWQRAKWSGLAKWVLRLSERIAVRWSHVVVADNQAIAEHVRETYGADCEIIAYGGDHAVAVEPDQAALPDLPGVYALGLSRIEPENNVAVILEAFAQLPDHPLVFVGNWDNSEYGRALRARYANLPNLHLLDPVYEPARLRRLRGGAWLYVHGHSAGGTNPSLVEMMHFGIAVVAYDCTFNQHSTEQSALYFQFAEDLKCVVANLDRDRAISVGERMQEIARRRYTWAEVGRAYFEVMGRG